LIVMMIVVARIGAAIADRLGAGRPKGASESARKELGFAEPRARFAEPRVHHQFQIQFLGGAAGEGPDIVEEGAVRAPTVFAAFRAAADNPWPPGATGLRILDCRGRNVFWRRKPGADNSCEFRLHLFSEDVPADGPSGAYPGGSAE
jgi:hypothetical protein